MMQLAQQRLEFVAVEEFISGRGLIFIYQILCQIEGRQTEPFKADDITRRAVSGECPQCIRTVDRFCAILGSYAGDVALTLGAFGGVYLGGGITPLLGHLFEASPFRARFEDKGRFQPYLARIPTYKLLSHSRVALRGAAALLNGEI
jgi:glucokinase